MVMRINHIELHRTIQDSAGVIGGRARVSHTPQVSTSTPRPEDKPRRFSIHLFETPSSNSVRCIELDETLLTGRLDDDIEILGMCG